MRVRGTAGWFLLSLILCLGACHPGVQPDRQRLLSPEGEYAYPVANPFAATVIGTPEPARVILPKEIPIQQRSLSIVDDRVVPDVFWYENRFRYSLATQRGKAPLVFIVAGTNAGYANRLSRFLQEVFFVAGYHVASLSSPTFPNFMVTASATSVPGRTSQDASDLYRAMQRVLRDVESSVPVDSVSLVGYSLGGWQSAFVAELDDRERVIDFQKVLLINPPVSLYRSSRVLDDMLIDNLPGGIDQLDVFINRVLGQLTEVYQRSQAVDFSQDLLYQAYVALRPTNDQLAALIGAAFRLWSANIAFTADVMSRSGYLVPADRNLRVSTSLTPYFDAGMRRGFIEYFEDLLYPYYKARDPAVTRQQIIAEASLERIEPYLASSEKIGVITNVDDVILAPGDIDFLRRTFAGRATIFPNGGHCGNMQDPHVVAAARAVCRRMSLQRIVCLRAGAMATAFCLLAGCAGIGAPSDEAVVADAAHGADRPSFIAVDDPWEGLNRRIYKFNAQADRWVLLPVVDAYTTVVPLPIRDRVSDFFANIGSLVTFANQVLQLKFEGAFETAMRFGANSLLGMFGLVDIATPMGLPRYDEDFGKTLGSWGFEGGPYLVLPILGPSNVRDTVGIVTDTAAFAIVDPFGASSIQSRYPRDHGSRHRQRPLRAILSLF